MNHKNRRWCQEIGRLKRLLVDPENDERRSSNACRYAAVEKEKLQAMPLREAAQVSRTPDHLEGTSKKTQAPVTVAKDEAAVSGVQGVVCRLLLRRSQSPGILENVGTEEAHVSPRNPEHVQ